MDGYVIDLSAKVIFGDEANRHYQGGKLGNLNVGSTSDHLERLVKKWFLRRSPVCPGEPSI